MYLIDITHEELDSVRRALVERINAITQALRSREAAQLFSPPEIQHMHDDVRAVTTFIGRLPLSQREEPQE